MSSGRPARVRSTMPPSTTTPVWIVDEDREKLTSLTRLLPDLAYYIQSGVRGPASAKAAEHLQRLIEIGQDESVLRHPAITDDPLAVDDEQGALRESLVPLPRAVADPVGVGGGAAPIRKEREVDAEVLREGHLGERGRDRDRRDVGARVRDVLHPVSQLGQLVRSDRPEVEHVEGQQERTSVEQVGQRDPLLEGSSPPEPRRPGPRPRDLRSTHASHLPSSPLQAQRPEHERVDRG